MEHSGKFFRLINVSRETYRALKSRIVDKIYSLTRFKVNFLKFFLKNMWTISHDFLRNILKLYSISLFCVTFVDKIPQNGNYGKFIAAFCGVEMLLNCE